MWLTSTVYEPVVLTSATVSEPMMQRLGLGADAAFTDVGSPFDHRAAALLYVPPLLASHPPSRRGPSNPDWFDEAWQEARTLMEAAEVFFGQSTHVYRPRRDRIRAGD